LELLCVTGTLKCTTELRKSPPYDRKELLMYSRPRHSKSCHNRRRFFKPGCERLEDRSLLAVLYGATGGNVNSDLYLVDTTTGATTSIGPIGFAVTGLAVDPISHTLYGSTSMNSPNSPGSIITIDKATGAGKLLT
jgi:hypothetical protein